MNGIDQYLSTAAVAKQYGFSDDSVRRWITDGVQVGGLTVRLEAVKVGKSWRVPPGGMEAFLAACNGREVTPPVDPAPRKRRDKEDMEYLESMGVG